MSKRTVKSKVTLPCNDIPAQPASSAPDARPTTRQICLYLLARPGGASLAEIGAATGWLAHSARAYLSGLRKQGHVIERFPGKDGQDTRWLLKAGE